MPWKKTKKTKTLKPFFLQQDEHECEWNGIHTVVDAPILHFPTIVRCLCCTREISIHQTLFSKSLLLHSGSQSCWASTHTHTFTIASEPIYIQVNTFCGKFLALYHYLLFQIVLCFFFFFSNLIWKLIWGYECIHLHSYELSIHQAFWHHGSHVIGDWGLVTAVSPWCFSLIFFLLNFNIYERSIWLSDLPSVQWAVMHCAI